MSFPKRPRGEKPTVTIAWQRRQMIQMGNRISELVSRNNELLDDYGNKDILQSEIEHELFQVKEAAQKQREAFYQKEKELMTDRQRLAFLEGFYEGTNRCSTIVMPNE